MFTGIIEEVGEITEAAEGLLRISAPMILEDAQLGDSIAINGVDLTVTHIESSQFLANLMPETYRRSNLGELQVGDRVNLERSVRPMDRLSGHLVRGVVEGRGAFQGHPTGVGCDRRDLRCAGRSATAHDRQGASMHRRRVADDHRQGRQRLCGVACSVHSATHQSARPTTW